MTTRRRFIRDAATGLMVPFLGPLTRAVSPLIQTPARGTVVASSTCLLLDSCTTSISAKGAYSVARKLRTAFGGNAFTVRRASDSTTQDIGFNADGTVNATDLASFCSGTDGFISKIYDQSGNSSDITQATTTAQPKVVTSGTVEVDSAGRVVMIFDGSDDRMSVTSITFGAQVTTFSVFQNTTIASGKIILTCGSTTRGAVSQSTAGGNHLILSSGTSLGSTITLTTTTRYIVRAFTDTAGNGSIKITNNAETSGNEGANSANAMAFGDSTNAFSGKLSEAIWFNTAINDGTSTSDQTAIISNMQTFYSI